MPTTPSTADDPAFRRLLVLSGILFLSYLCVAAALPAVPFYVSRQLGMYNGWAGMAVGIAFLSTILTRSTAGRMVDNAGGKASAVRGLWIYALAGAVCLAATWPGLPRPLAFAVLIAGRLLLGVGESYALVAIVAWGIGLMGQARAGRVMGMVGMAMYGAFAAGGPLGLYLLNAIGFGGLMAVCIALPLAGLLAVRALPAVAPAGGQRESFIRILGQIWRLGAVVGLQGVGFAALGAFISLDFASRGWPHAGLGLTAFGLGFVAIRITCSHLPDRMGGVPVAIASLAVEACGQYLLWLAPSPAAGLAGALLTGLGCSMVFPSMGVEVVKRVPAHLRGTAIGGFAAFQDLAYFATAPVTGLLADHAGYPSVFLVGGLAATLGLAMAVLGVRRAVVQPAG